MIEAALVIGIVVALTALLVRHRWKKRFRALAELEAARRDSSGLDVLARRYARGEIGRDEYLQMRNDILEFAGESVP